MSEATGAVVALAAHQARAAQPDPTSARGELAALLDLPTVGVEVLAARLFGRGRTASVEIALSNGETMVFDQARIMMRPAELVAEVAACAGVAVRLTGAQAARAFVLVRAIAEHHAVADENAVAADWGASYLQAADVLDLNMDDQAERWRAFERLAGIEPHALARESGRSLAAHGLVLRHTTGTRLVRCGWFLGHVRHQEAAIGQGDLARRMARVGWVRPGSTGRIKATAPGRADARGWNFYAVPDGWEPPQ